MSKTPDYCANCGEAVPPRAKACPGCGACEETGWSDCASEQSLGLPDDEFDYNEFAAREFGEGKPARSNRRLWLAVVAIILLALMGWGLFR